MSSKSSLILSDLKNAVNFLTDVISKPPDIYMRAAAIQAFEICFELSWKYLQRRLLESGLQVNSPRAAFRESGKAGLLDNVEMWLHFMEQRNLTVHTYQSQLAQELYKTISDSFLPSVQELLASAAESKGV
ncbi:MAG: nucleotidyltransferase [Acidimicrobiales bacterium]|nr:nucleotidyltransferase [Acidimicrobiales bacterium]